MMPAMRFIPLEFYWFEEGLYVVAASREHESEMHARITHINKTPIDDFDKIELTMEGLDGKVRSVMTDTCPSSDFHRSMPGPDNFWRKFGAS